jgi:hypothetical protein
VIRRRPVVLGTLALTVTLSGLVTGCSTFSDNDAAARVDDQELTHDELADLVEGLDTSISAEGAREQVQNWVVARTLEAEVRANGGEITDADLQAAREQLEPSFTDENDAQRELLTEFQAAYAVFSQQAPEVDPEQARAEYERGIEASGIACTAHILVETRAEADEVVAELEAGADFGELAAERSTDAGSAENGGALPCTSAAEFGSTYIPVFVEAALGAPVGEPTEPVESEFGWHVILVRPFEDLGEDEVTALWSNESARFQRALTSLDVYVDPRIGTFDPTAGVVPLG